MFILFILYLSGCFRRDKISFENPNIIADIILGKLVASKLICGACARPDAPLEIMPRAPRPRNDIRQSLAEYTLMDKTFHERYKIDFDEHKMKQVIKEAGHSFRVEEDYCDWELALEGIKTITKELNKHIR